MSSPDSQRDVPERPIISWWGTALDSNAPNDVAASLPWFIGGPIYAIMQLVRGLNVFNGTRYALTNRRIVVERGITRTPSHSVPLDSIDDVRVVRYIPFTRTGDIEIVSKGNVVLTMVGISDPHPARQTLLDAITAHVEVGKVLDRQRRAKLATA